MTEQLPLASKPANAPRLSPNVLYDVNLAVPLFSQNDPAWSGNIMQTCAKSIGTAGCTLTSAAMVFKYYGAVNKNPGQLNSCMGSSACPWYWATGANSCSENKATWNNLYGFDYGTLIWALENSWPPILELVNGDNIHWVVIKSIFGDGQSDTHYRIADPWDGQIKAPTNYTGSGYTKNRIAVYTKR